MKRTFLLLLLSALMLSLPGPRAQAAWSLNGTVVSTVAGGEQLPRIVSDGLGGAIVTWEDTRSGTSDDIYVSRIDTAGNALWTANGVALCTAVGYQGYPMIVTDGAGGAIVTWYDLRSGNYDIYARRIDAAGNALWTADGVALCTAAGDQDNPTIVTDAAGGAIVTWQDTRGGFTDIYARRIDTEGNALWTADGIAVCTAAGDQGNPTIVTDGAGGAIVTWGDLRSGTNNDIYARRIDAAGNALWTANGVALCTAVGYQGYPMIVTDGAGGAIVTWWDYRSGNYDIYARRIESAGNALWTADGVAVGAAAGGQGSPTIVSDGAGGAIVTWGDSRSGTSDIFAQRVEGRCGEWGRPEPVVVSVSDYPSDQGGRIVLRWSSERDRFSDPLIAMYSIWRLTDFVAASAAASGGSETRVVSDPSEIEPDFSGAAIWKEITPSGPEYWEWVAYQTAAYQSTYSLTVATRQDSTAAGPATDYFKVIAHEATCMVESNTVGGHSVDNLAPAAPLLLTAQRVGADVHLLWNHAVAPDLRDYSIYRATSSGVTPVSPNFLASSEETHAVDVNAPAGALFYIVTAYDIHANQSAPSNEASVGAPTGVGDTPSITALSVLGNMPNPFTATTTLRVGLPKASEVEVDVFDVAGRCVRSERTATLAAGWREIAFDARDQRGNALVSGVYFYRVKAAGATITRKMVIAR